MFESKAALNFSKIVFGFAVCSRVRISSVIGHDKITQTKNTSGFSIGWPLDYQENNKNTDSVTKSIFI